MQVQKYLAKQPGGNHLRGPIQGRVERPRPDIEKPRVDRIKLVPGVKCWVSCKVGFCTWNDNFGRMPVVCAEDKVVFPRKRGLSIYHGVYDYISTYWHSVLWQNIRVEEV